MKFVALFRREEEARHAAPNTVVGTRPIRFSEGVIQLECRETQPHDDCVHNLLDENTDIRLLGRARLYNVEELIQSLTPEGAQASPTDLLLAAYRKWGLGLAQHLIGDFCFIVWDRSASRLLAVRDHFGVRPLYYVSDANCVRVSNDERCLGIEPTSAISKIYACAFLAGTVPSGQATAHPGVMRVLPAEQLVIDASGISTASYWTLQPRPSPAEVAETEFRDKFITAVGSRIRNRQDAACMLSGGLDSTAIASVLRIRLPSSTPVKTYSMVYADEANRALDEQAFISTVVDQGGYAPNYVFVDSYQPLSQLQELFAEQLGPFLAPGLAKTRMLFERLRTDRIGSVFDGHGGDEIVWYGGSRIMELASQGRWVSALTLLPTHARLFGDNPLSTAVVLIGHYAPGNTIGRLIQRIARAALKRGLVAVPRRNWQTYLDPSVLSVASEVTRWRELTPEQRASDQANHKAALSSPLIGYAFEVLDRLAASFDIEVVFPFFDKRLAEFCLGLPASQKLRRGQTRSILRRALGGIVPQKILRRQDKTNFRDELMRAISTHHRTIIVAMREEAGGPLAPFVNAQTFPVLLTRALDEPHALAADEVLLLWRLACLYIWINMGGTIVDDGQVAGTTR